jgi:aspartyl protease family protein
MVRDLRPALPRPILSVYAVAIGPKTWRSLKLAVDTGATYTMLPPDLLFDIGYDPATAAKRLELSTASGLAVAPLLRIRTLKCLGLTVKDVEVVAHHLPPESPVEGLLGLNFLTHFSPFQVFYQSLRPFSV